MTRLRIAKVTRFYTTIVETTLVTGDVAGIHVKMPVYQDESQFANKTPVTVVKYEKDYGSYGWKVRLKYRIAGPTIFSNSAESILRINKLIWLLAEGSDAKVLVDAEKIKGVRVRYLDGKYFITGVKTEAYGEIPVKFCDILIDPQTIPDTTLQVNDFIKKNFTKIDLSGVELLLKTDGYDEEVSRAAEVIPPVPDSTRMIQRISPAKRGRIQR